MTGNLLTIAHAVAAELGEQWTAREGSHDGAVFLSNGNVEIFGHVLTYPFSAKGRIEWQPSYGHLLPDNTGSRIYDHMRHDERGEAGTETTTAADRDAKAIARQIERKVIPAAVKYTDLLRERLAAADVAKLGRLNARDQIAEALGRHAYRLANEDNRVGLNQTAGVGYGDFTINHGGQTGAIELHSVPVETMVAIAALLGKGE